MKKILVSALAASMLFSASLSAQVYKFKDEVVNPISAVKSQGKTGTCWCFASTGFVEAELIRMGKGELDLSEMFTVRGNYYERMNDNYLRHGNGNLGEGSIGHMTMNVIKKYGMITEEAYSGLTNGQTVYNHREMTRFIHAIADIGVKLKKRSPEYFKLQDAIFDTYLGEVPETFTYKGKEFTPLSFRDYLGFNPDDYIEITSFTHHPFYEKVVFEIPDNWDHARLYNLPLDEFMEVIDHALESGYTVCWDGDVSEKGYSFNGNAVCVIPTNNDLNRDEVSNSKTILEEVNVTQELRQEWFEAYQTSDDHLELIFGRAKDQNGNTYYKVKNSWGPKNPFNGYHYMSEDFIKGKTVGFMVHKDALPKHIQKKLGLK